MSVQEHLPDGSLVTEIAKLVHPTPKVEPLYRQKALVVGDTITVFEDPLLPEPIPLKVSTLTAVVDFVTSGIASGDVPDTPLCLQVVDATTVQVVAPLTGDQRQQFVYLVASPVLPSLVFRQYMEMEQFHIQLLSGFVDGGDRELLQAFCGKLKTGLQREIEDDGIAQKVTVMNGVTRSEEVTARKSWQLAPFRTFPEIEQPTSAFLLRLKENRVGDTLAATAALFEADGGKWRMQAITSIGAWLRAQLGDRITILA